MSKGFASDTGSSHRWLAGLLGRSVGSLPSTGVTRLRRYYEPVPPCASHRYCCASRLAETSFKADVIRGRVTMTTETAASGGVGLGRGGRMSRQRKRDAVLRLLRGEDLEILSRALGVTAATLTGWRDTFVAAGEASLA